ncbi:MAG TPA: tocopherol cyclase family protein, partial [Anaerolineales bacterium]|nr:tocopherol cyclase family protein [Anaerolineales bacterium]
MSIQTTLTPGTYHGSNAKPPFFEGWYYKMISADERHKLAIIPGVILGQDAHAFVQLLDGVDGTSVYHRFPFEQFRAEPHQFTFEIGKNRFDGRSISINIEHPEGALGGEIKLGSLSPWPVTLLSPGIMGWYAWIPRMECYHGVLSFNHNLQGALTFNGKTMNFTGGRGYIEKDWGQSFPAAWVWFQSNHFHGAPACITASVAIIPWLGRAFRGFIVGLWLNGRLFRFATYNGARIEALQISDDQVEWRLRNRRLRLVLAARRVEGGLLRGPTRLDMGKRVQETLNATVQVRLETIQGAVLYEGVGAHAGLEVMGDLPRLLHG